MNLFFGYNIQADISTGTVTNEEEGERDSNPGEREELSKSLEVGKEM